ncbi:MAG: AEC family transporter [Pygmaiobacter massiliensis]|nr:AEC family transporter [Pygmaiobacter massiliensis]
MKIQDMLQMQVIMFFLIALGAVLKKRGLITVQAKKFLSDLIIQIVLPCNIIYAFCSLKDPSVAQAFGAVLLVGFVTEVASVFLSAILYRRLPHDERRVLQFSTVVSNAGFMGNVIAEGIFGPIGMIYAAIYIIPQRLFMWSVGVGYFQTEKGKKRNWKKALSHPCMIAVYIGILLMAFRPPLPVVLEQSLKRVSDCTTALSMFVVGAILTEVPFRQLFSKTTVWFSALRLGGIPVVTLAVCVLAHMPPVVTGVSVVLAGMPAGATTSILATQYNMGEHFAAKIVVLTTALSMLTIPLWGLLLIQLGLV